MIRTSLIRGLFALGLGAGVAVSQEAPRITGHAFETNPAYERRVLLNRLQTDLVYVDRLRGEIPLDAAPAPPDARAAEPASDRSGVLRLTTRLALLLLVGLAAVALFRRRGWLAERFGPLPQGRRARRTAAPARPDAAPAEGAALLARLRAMTDRRAALVALLSATLDAAAEQNGLRLGRSETARELLRRLPRDWPHLPALRTLVMTEELVQFGGRPLPGPTFHACLGAAAPILTPAQGAAA
ncbi:DUF4129 domain-containing protein [Rhodobacteraceae bacterium 2CG4]|uniref:DUF4129 domain-containing protein n=1 Tax=Halovulum marinum TaxID=2662447 RepID=A0A6L5YV21_9RHOB|nr:DUF4129 domain-containing protein [Halovulum marinum]MSU88107.1 DUF4129 domain-containing protein [Halovulum marinum]